MGGHNFFVCVSIFCSQGRDITSRWYLGSKKRFPRLLTTSGQYLGLSGPIISSFCRGLSNTLSLWRRILLWKSSQKKFLWNKFFSPKITSNDQICIPIGSLRCLERPWKLWKQNILVKISIFLKIRLFHQNLVKKSKFLTWQRLFNLRNAMGSLQILD